MMWARMLGMIEKQLTDFRLQVFYAVAKNLSFTKASQELFISQPAISKHITKLEEQYQVRFFERQGNRIALTSAGQVMLQHCERILNEYNQLNYTMHLFNHEYVGQLRLGASTTISQYVLPPFLAKFIERYPRADISLINGNSRYIEQELIEHNIDLGLVEGVFKLPTLNYTPFMEDELIVLSSCHSPLAKNPYITLEQFSSAPLVLRERGSGSLDAIEQKLQEHYHALRLNDLNVKIYLGSTEAIKLFIKAADALCILSRYSVKEELADGSLQQIHVEGLSFKRNFRFVQALGPQNPLCRDFIEFVKEHSDPNSGFIAHD